MALLRNQLHRVEDELNMQKDFGLVLSKPYYLKLTQFVKSGKANCETTYGITI